MAKAYLWRRENESSCYRIKRRFTAVDTHMSRFWAILRIFRFAQEKTRTKSAKCEIRRFKPPLEGNAQVSGMPKTKKIGTFAIFLKKTLDIIMCI